MAPQPYTVNGRLTLFITVSGLEHKLRFPVRLVTPVTSAGNIVSLWTSTTTIAPGSAALAAWSQIRGLYNNGVAAPTWLVEENFGGIFVPIVSGSVSGAGGGDANPTIMAGSLIYTFKSAANHKLKSYLLETASAGAVHATIPTGVSVYDSFPQDMITPGAGSALNDFVCTRGGEQITRVTFLTGALNKRVRRSRHLV